MNLSSRVTRLEVESKPPSRKLITMGLAGESRDDIIGATIGELIYQRKPGETFAEFEQRIDDCPHRPAVAIAMMTYKEMPE